MAKVARVDDESPHVKDVEALRLPKTEIRQRNCQTLELEDRRR